MCGIVGYVGPQDAVPILLEGLAAAGVPRLRLGRARGHSAERACRSARSRAGSPSWPHDCPARLQGPPGIGHTRWATHGEPSDGERPPARRPTGRIAVVHNGIIENADELRAKLTADGVVFASETDTEVLSPT